MFSFKIPSYDAMLVGENNDAGSSYGSNWDSSLLAYIMICSEEHQVPS